MDHKLIDQYLDGWADQLAKGLVEIRYFDIDRIKAALSGHLKAAMMDCLQLRVTGHERRIDELKKLVADESIPYKERWKYMQEIGALNPEKKKMNRVLFSIRAQGEYGKLKNWVAENFGEEKLNEFFDIINKDRKNFFQK